MTNILLDTHVLLWTLDDSDRLDDRTRASLSDPEAVVAFSVASIWEIAIKAGAARGADFGVEPDEIARAARLAGFTELPVTAAVAALVARLPHHHRDPFDRLLIAEAMAGPRRFYTADRQLPVYSELVTLVGRPPRH